MIFRNITASILLLISMASARAQVNDERDGHTATAAEITAQTFSYNHTDSIGKISSTHQFAVVLSAVPATESVSITPCLGALTDSVKACAPATTSSVAATSQIIAVAGIYDYYQVTVSWTGSESLAYVSITGTHSLTLRRTGSGAYVVTANSVPSDGCATWSGGNVGSTGASCTTSTVTLAGDATGPSGSNTVQAVHATSGTLLGVQQLSDSGATPSQDLFMLSTSSGTTGGIPSGYVCRVTLVNAGSSTYKGAALCRDAFGSTYLYTDPNAHALGSQGFSYSQGFSANGTVSAGSAVSANTTYQAKEGATITAASTIAPTTALFHLTGTTTVATMTPPSGFASTTGTGLVGGSLVFVADSATPFSAGTGVGQFESSFTASAGTPYTCSLTPSTGIWYCK